ncbi:hypothetical protein [Lysobacter gummosus]|uniref:hypothetical protein n=1 Tax=Lysobacter gummosus TaxID=262324 RepID=UPI003644EF36
MRCPRLWPLAPAFNASNDGMSCDWVSMCGGSMSQRSAFADMARGVWLGAVR